MQTLNTWYKLHLCWRKVVLALLIAVSSWGTGFAQNNPTDNLINYDNQWIHYGFMMGIHSSKYVIKYSDAFVNSPSQDSVHSIVPGNLGGFKLMFVIDMKINDYLSFRMLPGASFYEYDLTYRFDNLTSIRELKSPTMVELPLLLKYKSVRRGNIAMYTVFGIKPSLEASGRGDELDIEENLKTKNWDLAIDVGVGLDIFYPYFKFSPEIRYSYGLRNMLQGETNDFSEGLRRVTTQNLGIFLSFEGGPDNSGNKKAGKIKKARKRKIKDDRG